MKPEHFRPHHTRDRKSPDPTTTFDAATLRRYVNTLNRLMSRVRENEAGCWLFTGTRIHGYGTIRGMDGLTQRAHRVAYELLVGSIPPGMTLDHKCRERSCVNPSHLEVVTQRENVLRGTGEPAKRARQIHCKRGHPLSGDNLYIERATGYRQCRECKRITRELRSVARRR